MFNLNTLILTNNAIVCSYCLQFEQETCERALVWLLAQASVQVVLQNLLASSHNCVHGSVGRAIENGLCR
jgi:hypothetical protein